ncbi:FK506-binding protein [Cladochytrium replicatum]|nr:FK506-binding protein [Cladochytrium replicatum]
MARKSLLFVLLLVVTLFVASASAAREPPKDLRIGIKKKVAENDCPRKSKNGDRLSMHYTGKLWPTGEKFDSSLDRNQPFEFTLGQGQVIKGWDRGLVGMCVGEVRRLIIPAHLGYGDAGAGDKIPPKSTLMFEVEMIAINGEGAPNAEIGGKDEL